MYAINKHPRKTLVHHLAALDKHLEASGTPDFKNLVESYPELSQELLHVQALHQRGDTKEARLMLTALRKRTAAHRCKKSQLNREIPDDTRRQIVSACAKKQDSYKSIAERFGLTETTLRHIRHEAGLPISHQQGKTSYTDKQLREALETTSNLKELAQLFAVHPASLHHRIRFL